MGPILSEFPNLPATGFDGVYADLDRVGQPHPSKPATTITQAEVLEHLQTVAGELLGNFLAVDPLGLTSDAPDDSELAVRVSAHVYSVWQGIPYAPNAVTAADVVSARGL